LTEIYLRFAIPTLGLISWYPHDAAGRYMPGHLRGRVTVGLNCAWACVAIALTAVAAALHVDRFAAGPAAADGFSSSHSSSGLSGGAAGTGVDAGLQAWQQLQLLASAPVAALWFVWLLAAPESARFLLLRGRTAEAEQALRDASVTAGTPLPAGYTFPWRRRQQSQHGHPLVQAAYHAEPADQDGQAAKGAALLSPMQVVSRRAFASCTWPPFGLIFTYVSPVLVTKFPMEPAGGGEGGGAASITCAGVEPPGAGGPDSSLVPLLVHGHAGVLRAGLLGRQAVRWPLREQRRTMCRRHTGDMISAVICYLGNAGCPQRLPLSVALRC
jgi:hypothetical protein